MAKKFILCILLLFAILAVGCDSHRNPLEYQSKDFVTDATLDINGKNYSVHIQKDNNSVVMVFKAPSPIKGVSIEKTREGLFFKTGNVHIPIKENSNVTAEVLRLFDMDLRNLSSNTPEMIGGVKANKAQFNCPFGKAVIYVSSDTGLPIMAEANINGNDVKLTFSNFSLNENSNETQ